jgi:predicted metalloprotease
MNRMRTNLKTLLLSITCALSLLLVANPASAAQRNGVSQDHPGNARMTTPTTREVQEVRLKIASAYEYLNQFWRANFATNGFRFVAPKLAEARCQNALYVPESNIIVIDTMFFLNQMRSAARQTGTDGDFAYIVILAHEFGHAVQYQLGLAARSSSERELQADKLAGVFARYALEKGLLDPGDLEEADYAFSVSGDSRGYASYKSGSHGTSAQRRAAFRAGLQGGIESCGIF